MTRNRIIFLVRWPITPRDNERLAFDYLRTRGFRVEVYDLSRLLEKEALKAAPPSGIIEAPFIKAITSYRELAELIRAASRDSIFIEALAALNLYTPGVPRVMRLLTQHRAIYTSIISGLIPASTSPESQTSTGKRLLKRLRSGLDVRRLARFAAIRTADLLRRRTRIFDRPTLIFCKEWSGLDALLRRYRIPRDRVRTIHSLDYDRYLEYLRANPRHLPDKPNCIYLDEANTHHPDFAMQGIRPADPNLYYPELNKLFAAIESNNGCKVVVAAHPLSQYETLGNPFQGREIVKGKTIDLVASSHGVVAHASTAISFAVLFRKPVLLAHSSALMNGVTELTIEALGKELGIRPVHISSSAEIDREEIKFENWQTISMERYESYLHKYVMSEGTEAKPTWEIIADELSRLGR